MKSVTTLHPMGRHEDTFSQVAAKKKPKTEGNKQQKQPNDMREVLFLKHKKGRK